MEEVKNLQASEIKLKVKDLLNSLGKNHINLNNPNMIVKFKCIKRSKKKA